MERIITLSRGNRKLIIHTYFAGGFIGSIYVARKFKCAALGATVNAVITALYPRLLEA